MKKYISFSLSSVLLIIGAGFLMYVPSAHAVAVNAATKTDTTPGTQFTTFKGVPVFKLNIVNSGDAPDTITTLSPTPAGTADDTKITLHFFKDVNNNGVADQGDIDLGASAAFATNDTNQVFNITDVVVPPAGGAVSILITADGLALTDTNTFTLGFAAATDIAMSVTPTGTFAMNNANALTVSNVAPAVTVANGANDPAAKYVAASAANVAVKQLAISAASGTSDSIVSIAPTPSGTENDNTNVSSVVFYIDSGSVLGQVDGTDVRLVSTPATFSADNTKTVFTFSNPIQITQGAAVNILIVYNLGAGATNAATLIQTIAVAGDAVAGSGTAVTKTATVSATVNIDNAPTVSSVSAFTDRMVINFSENVDGMTVMNCANYTIGGSVVTCGGMGLPFVEFQGNKATIKGLTLSGTTSLVIASNNTIKDIDGGLNSLAAYSDASITVNALVLPSITSLSATSGAVGGSLTITGTNFGADPGGSHTDANHKVFFSGGFSQSTGSLPPVEVTSYTSWSATSIVVVVPSGANGGPVNVMVDGVMSDMNQNSFFDIAGNYTAKVYYDAAKTTPMPDDEASNIRIAVGGMRGMVIYSTDNSSGNAMTYDNDTNTFTVSGLASMGFIWAYDIRGTHLNAQGAQVNTSATQDLIMLTTTRKISGTVTLGTSCAAGGQSKDVVVMAMPNVVDNGDSGFKEVNPAFFRTNGSCVATYAVAIPINGTYRVEAHIPPDASASTVSSSAYTDPDSQLITITDVAPAASNKNFTFSAATHRIVGSVVKPVGEFGSAERGMLWVFAYQPQEGGKGTGTQVAEDGTFTVYVTPGMWKVGVGGPNMPFPVEVSVEVDNTYELADPAKGPTIIIAPPSDFIEGYVKDSAGNGLSNASLYAWREGGPGGGNAKTDSQGYYKMYVTTGSGYHVGADSQSYGFLGEQSDITVSGENHPTVNFNVSSSDNYTISGTVTKGGTPLQEAFVFITSGENGSMLGGGGTDSSGAYTVRVSGGSSRWLHVGSPGKGEIYVENLGTISANNASKNITITSSIIKVRISPASSFSQAFVGLHSSQGGGFSDTPVVTADCTGSGSSCREYQIEIPRPSSGSTTYYVDGGIPGYGPLSQISVAVDSSGVFTETSDTANDGIIVYTLSGLYTVSGTVTGDNVTDAWVWASSSTGGGGGSVDGGIFSFQLKEGTYDLGVGKPDYIGNKISITVSGADLPNQALTLTSASQTITGTVYLPDGSTAVTNAWVWADNGSGGWAGDSTDATGAYSLNVGSGDWTVKAAYDGYNSASTVVTAPATGRNINLVVIAGFAPSTKNNSLTPSDGGIVQGSGIKVDFPKNALGTDTSAGTVEVKNTTNVPTITSAKIVGNAKEITARDSNNRTITTISGTLSIELTATKTEINAQSLTLAQVNNMTISYWDSTSNNWVDIPTVVTLSVPGATTVADLDEDPAVTLTGTVSHLSSFALNSKSDSNAPDTPTNFAASALASGQAYLTWTASSGATKYDIYQRSGDTYPYLAQTTNTHYTVSGLSNGTTYYYKVSALDSSDRESAATSAVSVTPVSGSGGGGGGGGSYTPTPTPTPTPSASPSPSATPAVTASPAPTASPVASASPVSPANATVIASLQQQINALIAQLTILIQERKAAGLSVPASAEALLNASPNASFNRNLTIGSVGDDVKALQQFLNSKGFKIAVSGPGSPGSETTRFGLLTKNALAKYQASAGISPALGYFGPLTRAKVNAK